MLRAIILLATLCLTALLAVEPINFDYSDNGDNWVSCPKNGNKQSPIQLSKTGKIQKNKESFLFGDYFNTTGTANFLNTTVYINTSDSFGGIYTKLIDGTSVPFKATQIRIRMHSQHKTEQGYFDIQIQIFHSELYLTSRNYKLAVGLLFKVGENPDSFISQIIKGYELSNVSATIQVDLRTHLPTNIIDDYWFYNGSPTIPSCNDGKLHWVVSGRIYSITEQQKQKMTQILSNGNKNWSGNWRKIQAQNTNLLGLRHISAIQTQ